MTLELSHREPGYLYETTLRPAGVAAWFKRGAISERTTLMNVSGAIWPVDYYSQDTIENPVRNTAYIFDREGGRVTGQYKSQSIDVAFQAGGHDRISVHIAIMLALQSNAEIANYLVFDRGRWKDYQFEVTRDQTVKTPCGRFNTVEVRYSPSDSDKSWTLHFAPDLAYLPVMIMFHERGKLKSRAQLTDYQIDDPHVSPRK